MHMCVAGAVSAMVIPEGMQDCILRVRVWQAGRQAGALQGLLWCPCLLAVNFYHEFYPHGGNIQQKITGAT